MTVGAIDYSLQARKHLVVKVTVVDVYGGSPLSGMQVDIDLILPDGIKSSTSGTTDSNGAVTYRLLNASNGTYTTEVTRVEDPNNNYVWDEKYPENSYIKK
jgi:hypothetical protein